MDDKLRQELLDGLDKMGEMLDDLRSTTKEETSIQPEPQAGDMWVVPGVISYLFVHPTRLFGLGYTWSNGEKGGFSIKDKINMNPGMTRIFSLSEYLKEKEEGE